MNKRIVVLGILFLPLSGWLFFMVTQLWVSGELFHPSSSLLEGQELYGAEEHASITFRERTFSPSSEVTLVVQTGGTLRSHIYRVVIHPRVPGLDDEVLLDSFPYSWKGTITEIGGNDFVGDEEQLRWQIQGMDKLAGEFIDITVELGYSAAVQSGMDTYVNRDYKVEIPLTIRLLTDSEMAEINETTRTARTIQILLVVGFVFSNIIVVFLTRYLCGYYGDNQIIRLFALVVAAMLSIMLFELMMTASDLVWGPTETGYLVFILGGFLAIAIGGAVYYWTIREP